MHPWISITVLAATSTVFSTYTHVYAHIELLEQHGCTSMWNNKYDPHDFSGVRTFCRDLGLDDKKLPLFKHTCAYQSRAYCCEQEMQWPASCIATVDPHDTWSRLHKGKAMPVPGLEKRKRYQQMWTFVMNMNNNNK